MKKKNNHLVTGVGQKHLRRKLRERDYEERGKPRERREKQAQ
jgi:hypothetical protein